MSEYVRAGVKYKITCAHCGRKLRVELPKMLILLEIAFAASGSGIITILVLMWAPVEIAGLEVPLIAVAQMPWLLLNFHLNILLDGRYGELKIIDDKVGSPYDSGSVDTQSR